MKIIAELSQILSPGIMILIIKDQRDIGGKAQNLTSLAILMRLKRLHKK